MRFCPALRRGVYLSPNDPVGQEAFSVIRDAMDAQEMVGISRLVISRRERAVMLEPRDKGRHRLHRDPCLLPPDRRALARADCQELLSRPTRRPDAPIPEFRCRRGVLSVLRHNDRCPCRAAGA